MSQVMSGVSRAVWALIGLAGCIGGGKGDTSAGSGSDTSTDSGSDTSTDSGSDTSPDSGPDTDSPPDTGATGQDCDPAIPTAPGVYEGCLYHDGYIRRYTLVIPEGYDGSAPWPLLHGFHAGDATVDSFRNNTGIGESARLAGMIAVYPQGLGFDQSGSVTNTGSWDAYHCCGASYALGTDDMGMVDALHASLVSALNVDEGAVFAVGYSNGAMLTHRLMAERSERYAAGALYAGTIGGEEPTIPAPARPVSLLMAHGYLDTAVRYDGGVNEGGRYDASQAESVGFWVGALGCDPIPTTEQTEDGGVVRESYGGCDAGTAVQHIRVMGADHAWPDAQIGGVGLSDLMMSFLLQHRR